MLINKDNCCGKIQEAAARYNSAKFSELFYQHYLDVLKNAAEADESVGIAVKYLFLWKLGKISLQQTVTSEPLVTPGLEGYQYYVIGTTQANYKVISKAIEIGRLNKAISKCTIRRKEAIKGCRWGKAPPTPLSSALCG